MATSHLSTQARAHGGRLTIDYAVARHFEFSKKLFRTGFGSLSPNQNANKKVQLQFVPRYNGSKLGLSTPISEAHEPKRVAVITTGAGGGAGGGGQRKQKEKQSRFRSS